MWRYTWITRLWQQSKNTRRKLQGTPKNKRSRPRLEALEDRTLLSANTYLVDLVGDAGTSTGALSGDIRYCINQADQSANAGSTITFDSSLSGQTIALADGELAITDNMTITGPGASSLTISGNNQSRIFTVDAGATAAISGLTITGGSAGEGGGIENLGNLMVSDCTLSGNHTGYEGGAIESRGSTTVSYCTLTGNSSANDGGAITITTSGAMTISNSTLSSNSSGFGGGIYNESSLALSDCTLSGNSATYDAGGIDSGYVSNLTVSNSTLSGNTCSRYGGGIVAGGVSATVSDSTLSGNSAGYGGGIYNTITLTVSSSTLSGNTASEGGGVFNAGSLTLSESTILSGNSASTSGGGIYNTGSMTVSDCKLSGNSASNAGGGIWNAGTLTVSGSAIGTILSGNSASSQGGGVYNNGSLTLSDCTLSSNSASEGGGILTTIGPATLGDCTLSGNSAGDGGGICGLGTDFNGNNSYETLTIGDCTLSGNSAAEGGGLFADRVVAMLTNDTIAGNSASADGGGVFTTATLATLTNDTIAANSSSGSGGGIYISYAPPYAYLTDVIAHNTLIASNLSGGNPSDVPNSLDGASDYNLIGDGSGGLTAANHNQLGSPSNLLNPLLAPLGNYGGPTQTMALSPGSPAIGAGSTADVNTATDQRGFPRIVNGLVDIGAYQTQASLTKATGLNIAATEGTAFSGAAATFQDTSPGDNSAGISATITWGDGNTSAGTVSYDSSSGLYTVSGSVTYAEEGSYAISVAIGDGTGDTASATSIATVADAPLSGTGANVSPVEGTSFTGVVATLADADRGGTVSDYTTAINWGDGNTSTGTIVANGTGGFNVVGSHTYVEEGSYAISVTINDTGDSGTTENSTATVADAPLSAAGVNISAVEGAVFNGIVATFTDADLAGTASDYTATITWGDGNTSTGAIVAGSSGGFNVLGSHTYAEQGNYVVSVAVSDAGGSTAVNRPAGAISWWKAEGNANDSLGSNNGTLQGGVSFVPGESGQAFYFNGSDNVYVPASASLDVGQDSGFTVEEWINPDNATQGSPLVEWLHGVHLWMGDVNPVAAVGGLYANIVDTSGQYHPFASPGGILQAGVYQQVALTYDKASGVAALYLNGAVVAQQNLGSFTPLTSTDLYLGDRPPGSFPGGSSFYTGAEDETLLFDRALSGSEIQALFNGGGIGGVSSTATVADAPLTAGPLTVSPGTEGASPSNLNFTFTDANSAAPSSDFSGTINWGDGTTAAFTSSAVTGSGGSYTVSGSHQYAEEGSYNVSVTINDAGGSSTTENSTATVADAPLTAGALTPPVAVPTVPIANANVFHFTDADPNATSSDYSALVTLGDGNQVTLSSTPSANGQIVQTDPNDPSKGFDVQLSYTYAAGFTNGTFGVVVTDHNSQASASANGFTVIATPTVPTPTAANVTYDGNPHGATVGDVIGVNNTDLGAPTLTYYTGTYTINNLPSTGGSSTAPTNAGNYTVVASYAGSTDYTSASSLATYNIGRATLTVSSAADDGSVGTLRYAITQANSGNYKEIDFAIGAAGSAQTISLTSTLPALTTNGVYINGLSQGGSGNTTPPITLDGSAAGTADGFVLQGSNCTVSGLIIENFSADGIEVEGTNDSIGGTANGAGNVLSGNGNDGVLIDSSASGVLVEGNYIGTDVTGSVDDPNLNGVVVSGSNNTIGGTLAGAGNLISGNTNAGVYVLGAADQVQGNWIGTDATGTKLLANLYGVEASDSNDTIGGTTTAARNVISGNVYGVMVNGSGQSGVQVQGNFIGTDVTGTKALPNFYGVYEDASNNTIGGTASGAGNVISGNTYDGVYIQAGIFGVQVQGNEIGTDVSGTKAVANVNGVVAAGSNNTIGGTATGAGNVISGNTNDGVLIDNKASGVQVQGNEIGTDATATLAISNSIGVEVAASNNTIGGTATGAGNVIVCNSVAPVQIDSGATGVLVQGNIMGPQATPTVPTPIVPSNAVYNGQPQGASVGDVTGVNNTDLGAPTLTYYAGTYTLATLPNSGGSSTAPTQAGNYTVVASYAGSAVYTSASSLATYSIGRTTLTVSSFADDGSVGTLRSAITQASSGNYKEIDFAIAAAGSTHTIRLTSALPTLSASGVYLNGLSQGGSGNTRRLITLDGSGAGVGDGLILQGSSCTVSGLIIQNFSGNGIEVEGTNDSIGGTANGAGNIISGNGDDGVLLDSSASGALLQGNYIGLSAGGNTALANGGNGIEVQGVNNTLGGTVSAARNCLSGNGNDGVLIDSAASGNRVLGNFIGLDRTGTQRLSNSANGVEVGGSSNTIGGTVSGASNYLSGNSKDGLLLDITASANLVVYNDIGSDKTGQVGVGNGGNGMEVMGNGNTLGGTRGYVRNIVSGNSGDGVRIDSGASGNVLLGNYIGVNASSSALGNSGNGVNIIGNSNTIGGTASGSRNILAGNSGDGVLLASGASGNLVQDSYVGLNALGSAVGNSGNGVEIAGNSNTIGGTVSAARNILSANSKDGVLIDTGSSGNVVQGNYIGLNASGTAALGNSIGIEDAGSGDTLGGTVSGARNVISGNSGDGVLLNSSAKGEAVQDNYIGLTAKGTAALANGGNGVEVQGVSNTIGGTAQFDRNYVSGNGNDGVLIDSAATGNVLQNDFLGLDTSGTHGVGNVANGVEVAGSGNTIGGTVSGATNIESGNSKDGILLDSTASSNVVADNWVGTDKSGKVGVANSGNGVEVMGASNTLGGVAGYARNIIAGNSGDGVLLDSGASGTLVQGNYIGVNYSAAALGNSGNGVEIASNSNTIGGTVGGARNIISGNSKIGVLVSAGSGTTISRNSIYANTGQGISLSSGANNNLAAPSLSSATLNGSTLTVKGSFTAPTANVSYVLEFFANVSGDPEGRIYLGSLTVKPTTTGTQSFTYNTTNTSQLGTYPLVTATLTDTLGDTSVFSNGVTS